MTRLIDGVFGLFAWRRRVTRQINRVTEIQLQILAPAEGNSAVVEVCDQNDVDFLHVCATRDGDHEFRFYTDRDEIRMSKSDILRIIEKAEKNVRNVDLDELPVEAN